MITPSALLAKKNTVSILMEIVKLAPTKIAKIVLP